MNFSSLLRLFMGWPLIIYVVGIALVASVYLGFVQVRYFFKSWKFTLFPEKVGKHVDADMSPFQAFVNALNTSLGNGAIAGMGTALYAGGPGAAFWLLVTSFLTMSIRYCESFLAAYFGARETDSIGGPMLYLKKIVGGRYIAYIYGFFMFVFGLVGGNAIQTNSVREGLSMAWNVPHFLTAVLVLLFILYVLFGGAARIVRVTDRIVPVKIGAFLISTFIILIYHYQNLLPALRIIFKSAWTSNAVVGGAIGFAIQSAMRFGMMRSVFATESGLGTSAILFGSTGSKEPVKTGLMSMLATVISSLFCFIIGVCIVASGVWTTGLDGAALTIASYNTVFGWVGSWIVTFLIVAFGMGVLVTFAYLTREAWSFLTGGRWMWMHAVLYGGFAFFGAVTKVGHVWFLSDIAMTGMLILNLFGIVLLLPLIRKELNRFSA